MAPFLGTLTVPSLAAAPAAGPAGSLYYNTSDGNLYKSNGSAWSVVFDPALFVPANSGTASALVLVSPEERCTVSATAATGTVHLDAVTQGVLFYTSNASANFTLNVRGNSGTTLNSLLAVGDSITVVFLVTNGATPYYPTAFQIDGSAVTPKWAGGVAPAAGNANSIDAYSLTIIKTAAATFTVLASAGRFA